jgi:hypothetical protein
MTEENVDGTVFTLKTEARVSCAALGPFFARLDDLKTHMTAIFFRFLSCFLPLDILPFFVFPPFIILALSA